MSLTERGLGGDRQFPVTSWSLILNPREASPEAYARHMTRLAETYWRPVYSFIRHMWRKSHHDAKDLTQEFFANVIFERKLIDGYEPARGGFRPFLRMAIARFMVDELRVLESKKRGGGLTIASLEALNEVGFQALPDETSRTPEQLFDLAWREAVMSEALGLLQQRLTEEGRGAEFEVFKRYDVDGDSADLSYAELARAMGMTARQLRHALTNARTLFRAIVTEIVSGYAGDRAELKAELRALFGP